MMLIGNTKNHIIFEIQQWLEKEKVDVARAT